MKQITSWEGRNYVAALSISSTGELQVEATVRENGFSQDFSAWLATDVDTINEAVEYADVDKYIHIFDEEKNVQLEDAILQDCINAFIYALMNATKAGLTINPRASIAWVIHDWYALI